MGQVHSPWMVQPRSPVAKMPRSEDMQLTTACHEFSCGCSTPQCEPEQRGLQHISTLGTSLSLWPREIFPLCVCASAICF